MGPSSENQVPSAIGTRLLVRRRKSRRPVAWPAMPVCDSHNEDSGCLDPIDNAEGKAA